MIQRAVAFGPGSSLVGILTTPQTYDPNGPVVVFVNAGLVPRVGPHRINVKIAHALASDGLRTFRFDLSGIGDSRSEGRSSDTREQAVADIKSAIDWLETATGAKTFLFFGVCSGAVNAYDLAFSDRRLAGVFMFDGFTYLSRWTTLVRHIKRARAVSWKQRWMAIRRRTTRTADATNLKDKAMYSDSSRIFFKNPPIEDYTRTMQTIVDRGTDVFVVTSGSLLEHYSYDRQYQDVFGAFDFSKRIRCEYHPDIDHIFLTRHAQTRIVDLVRDWARPHVTRKNTSVQSQ